jgi:ribosomal protein L16 Arg81 hydroxylase
VTEQARGALREGRSVLPRLVPHSTEEFAREYWGRRPLYVENAARKEPFADLFSLDAVDELLSRRGLRTPFIRLVRDGVTTNQATYVGSGGAGAAVADQVRDERVLELFADGHTVVLQALHRLWPPLIDFAGDLAAELGHPVQINAYVTPASAQGFKAHYDVHDVFVVQITGDKRWIVHEPVHVDPLRSQPSTGYREAIAARVGEPPILDVVLHPGDVLYLPRGFIHAAEALGGTSVHLTVGVQAHTRQTIVEALVKLAGDETAVRRSLPLGIDVTDPDAMQSEVAATVDDLVRMLHSVQIEAVTSVLAQHVHQGMRPAPLSPVAQAEALAALNDGSVIHLRRHLDLSIDRDGEDLVLRAAGRTVQLPVTAQDAIEMLLEGGPVSVRELAASSDAERLDIVRELLRAGIAVPAASG